MLRVVRDDARDYDVRSAYCHGLHQLLKSVPIWLKFRVWLQSCQITLRVLVSYSCSVVRGTRLAIAVIVVEVLGTPALVNLFDVKSL